MMKIDLNGIRGSWPTVGLIAVISIAMLPEVAAAAQSGKSPVKVFILAGQSNMEGQGAMKAGAKNRNEGKGTLEYLVKDPATAERFKHTIDKNGDWLVRDDVWIWYLGRKGGLSAGYGAKKDKIGPERKDLGAKDLPFVIANSGFGGREQKNVRRLGIMKAQAAAAALPEFKGNVTCVETRDFFCKAEDSPSNQGYHWNGSAETYFLIGDAMAEAMKKLCN